MPSLAAAVVPTADSANVTGVLDRLSVSATPVIGDDGQSATSAPAGSTPDPVAVPTPTAAQSGLAVIVGVVGWRWGRRGLRRLTAGGTGR